MVNEANILNNLANHYLTDIVQYIPLLVYKVLPSLNLQLIQTFTELNATEMVVAVTPLQFLGSLWQKNLLTTLYSMQL